MENIDKKIDVLLRQKLLMGYNPSDNLNENIENAASSKKLLNEVVPLVVAAIPYLTGAAYVGGITMTGWGIWNFADGAGRNVVRNKIEDFFNFCKRNRNPLNVDRTKTNNIAKELWTAFERKGFLGSGIGTDEEGVYNALKKLSSIGEFCSVIDEYYRDYAQGGSSLWREIKDEMWRTAELEKVEAILTKLYDQAQQDLGQRTSCLVKLIKRRFNTTTLPTGGTLLIAATNNKDIETHGGIVLKGLFPDTTGFNWETKDGQIKGVTTCAQNGCVIFQGSNGCKYLIDQCNPSGKGCIGAATGGAATGGAGGGGAAVGGRFCPDGYNPPTDGVYKKCKSGDPVKKVQQCLGVNDDGKFGPRTLRALRIQKDVESFREENIPSICASTPDNPVTPPPAPPTQANNYGYQPLDVVPIAGQGQATNNNRF
jgi:hypothetical protein